MFLYYKWRSNYKNKLELASSTCETALVKVVGEWLALRSEKTNYEKEIFPTVTLLQSYNYISLKPSIILYG